MDTKDYHQIASFKNGKHAEKVLLLQNIEGNKIIKKRYHQECANIFHNEVKILKYLHECDFVPKLLKVKADTRTIYMSYCGPPLSEADFKSYKTEIQDLENQLIDEWHIYHNDIKLGNVCQSDGKLYLIDFGWSGKKPLKAGYGTSQYRYSMVKKRH